jgi:penicillin-binding protein 1A
MGKTGTTNEFRDALFIGSTYGLEGITVAVRIGFDDSRSLGQRETGGRVALPVFREIMLGVYRKKIMDPVPEFPAQMEQSIDAYLRGDSVVPASDANRQKSEITLEQRDIEDGEKGSPQVQPEPQPGRPASDPSWSPDDNRSHDGSPTL